MFDNPRAFPPRSMRQPPARGQRSSLHEGPVNTRSAHDVRFTRRGRSAKLYAPPSSPSNPVSTGVAMSKTAITSPELAPPVGPFSQAVKIEGFFFFSERAPQDPPKAKVAE